MLAEVDLHAMNDRIDAGAPFRETICDTAAAHPDWARQVRRWHDHWIEMASPRIEASIALCRALRARGVPVFALTSFCTDRFAFAQTQPDFLSEFDRSCVSGRMGVIKPDPAFFWMVEEDSGILPSRLIFTDDRADNIAAAAARGWRPHLFTGPQGWAQALAAAGLLDRGKAEP